MTEIREIPSETQERIDHELAQARAAEERNARRREEQMDDGFVSEFVDGLSSREHRLQAEILANGGTSRFLGLFDVETGARVRAKLIDGRYGLCWAMCDDDDRFTGRFYPWNGGRGTSRKLPAAGLREDWEQAPAKATIRGSGTGLSGLATCHVVTVRTDDGYPDDAVVYVAR